VTDEAKPTPVPLSLAELRARHVAFVTARVRSETSRLEWRTNLEAAYQALLAAPLGELLVPSALEALVDEVLARRTVAEALHPIAVAAVEPVLAQLRAHGEPVGSYVPAAARRNIEALVSRPGVLHPHLVREVLGQEALEDVMRDVLSEALLTFNERVNPFFAEWGLPGLLKRVMPFGSGGVTKALEALRVEFDKRLEPEVKRFLQGFSRQALDKAAEFVVTHQDDAKFVAVRKAVVAWVYEQPVGGLVGTDGPAAVQALEVARDVATAVLAAPTVRDEVRAMLTDWLAREKATPVGELLKRAGVTAAPPFDALANLTWPAVTAAFASPAVLGWLTSFVTEFYDSLEGAPS
jgi:hypothetical protein